MVAVGGVVLYEGVVFEGARSSEGRGILLEVRGCGLLRGRGLMRVGGSLLEVRDVVS